MFKARKNAEELRAELASVEAEIAAHPLNSEQMSEARHITQEHRDEGIERVQEELASRGLPSLEEQGRVTAKNMLTFWKLNRRKNKLLKQLAKN